MLQSRAERDRLPAAARRVPPEGGINIDYITCQSRPSRLGGLARALALQFSARLAGRKQSGDPLRPVAVKMETQFQDPRVPKALRPSRSQRLAQRFGNVRLRLETPFFSASVPRSTRSCAREHRSAETEFRRRACVPKALR